MISLKAKTVMTFCWFKYLRKSKKTYFLINKIVQKDITAHLFLLRKKRRIKSYFFSFIHLNYICANTLSAEKKEMENMLPRMEKKNAIKSVNVMKHRKICCKMDINCCFLLKSKQLSAPLKICEKNSQKISTKLTIKNCRKNVFKDAARI